MVRVLVILAAIGVMAGVGVPTAQTQAQEPPAAAPQATAAPAAAQKRPPNPKREPSGPGYVTAKELPDGAIPTADVDGNFIIGPTHNPAPEMAADDSVPKGTVYEFTMSSADSKFYPGIAKDENATGEMDPKDPTRRLVTAHPAPYTRHVAVYVPKQYVAGTAAPFMLGTDGVDRGWFTVMDNLIAQHRVPAIVAISIANGGGDGPGSERGLEYDTMSGKYAEWVEAEVLPLVEKTANVKLTKDPDGRATMGASSGGSCAMAMAWYHTEWYHRVLTRSGTFVNNQWPHNDAVPHGAWELHEQLIPGSPAKPLRIWMQVGDRDNYGPAPEGTVNMHDWVAANENMAKVLAAKGYHYQFMFARNAGHTDRAVRAQVLPEAIEYIWKDYPVGGKKN